MILQISQLTPESIPAFVMFIVGGSATVFLVNQALTFYKAHMKEQPTPSATYATKVELTKVEGELKGSLSIIGDELKAEARSQAGKRKQIYEDIEQLGKDMSAMKADQTNQTRQLYSLETKMDRVLERLPRP